MGNMTVKIRMHPAYADFIKFDFDSDENGRVFATERKPIGLLIKNLLSLQPENAVKRDYEKDAYIEFTLPYYKDINIQYRNYISLASERLIAKKIKNQFYFELNEFILETFGAGHEEFRSAIVLFCEQMEIRETSYKINTIEKEYRRYRSRQKTAKKAHKMSSTLMALFSYICPTLFLFALISHQNTLSVLL